MRKLAAAGLALLALTACSVNVTTDVPTATPTLSTGQATPGPSCGNATQTFAALAPLPAPGQMPKGTILDALAGRGRLIVGVVSDQQPLSWRDPVSGDFKGFEVDLHRTLAKALTGDETKVEIRVISLADAPTLLKDQSVDVVVAGTPMTCEGWTNSAYSAPYLQVAQHLLGRRGGDVTTTKGRRVCVVAGSPYGQGLTDATLVSAQSATQCLSLLQSGTVDVVTDSLPVLQGLAAQDPFVAVAEKPLPTQWEYAVRVSKDRPLLTQFVSAALAQWVAGGGWQQSYDQWLKPQLGAATAPAPQYGRPS